jgi:hypothetical protein
MLRCAARCAQLRAAPPSRRFLSSAGADVSAALAAAAAADAGAGADAEWGREGVERVGVVMLNMGGPSSLHGAEDGVKPFLTRLFSDPEIIGLGGGLKQVRARCGACLPASLPHSARGRARARWRRPPARPLPSPPPGSLCSRA